nr:MAG TPA: hypothetical protein [Caudoviricetes sp.]
MRLRLFTLFWFYTPVSSTNFNFASHLGQRKLFPPTSFGDAKSCH